MLKDITPGDVVTVTRIDRLARSTFDLFAIVKRIVDAGGQFRFSPVAYFQIRVAKLGQHRGLRGGRRYNPTPRPI